jgi:hypothetical protein
MLTKNIRAASPVVHAWLTLLLLFLAQLCGLSQSAAMAAPNDEVKGHHIVVGDTIKVGQSLVSPNGEFFLTTQSDGNFCVYHEYDNGGVWCSRSSSAGEGSYFTALQTDGNLCTYRQGGGNAVWCISNQSRNDGPYFMALQDDANVCVYRGVYGQILDTVWCSMGLAQARVHGPRLVYGKTYHLQNGWDNWSGGFLDTRGAWCDGNTLCVSTSVSENRDGGSGTWMIMSAEGKALGTDVKPGDTVYLKNQYAMGPDDMAPYAPFGGYLDVRGVGCEGNVLCVSTSMTKNSGPNTSKWTVVAPRHFVFVDQGMHLQNNYTDANTAKTYLDTRSSRCEDNLLCVSTSATPVRDGGTGTWRFVNDVSHYAEKFAPRLRFDNAGHGYPMSAQAFYTHAITQGNTARLENTDPGTLQHGTIPTYYQVIKGGNQLRIKYWWFYGYQNSCDAFGNGSHNGDWEDVTVILAEDRSSIAAITFSMHGHTYTRLADRNGFDVEEGSHPVVYVAKNSHASHFENGGTSVSCLPWDEFHNTSNGTRMDSWKKLVDLNGAAEPWMASDRAGSFVWGPDGVSTHPTQKGPSTRMNAADWTTTIDTWRHSQCKKGDADLVAGCLRRCRSGYTDIAGVCTEIPFGWSTYTRSTYGFDYEIPNDDRGLLSNED